MSYYSIYSLVIDITGGLLLMLKSPFFNSGLNTGLGELTDTPTLNWVTFNLGTIILGLGGFLCIGGEGLGDSDGDAEGLAEGETLGICPKSKVK